MDSTTTSLLDLCEIIAARSLWAKIRWWRIKNFWFGNNNNWKIIVFQLTNGDVPHRKGRFLLSCIILIFYILQKRRWILMVFGIFNQENLNKFLNNRIGI